LSKYPEQGIAKESRNMLNGLLERVSWDTMFYEYNDGGSK